MLSALRLRRQPAVGQHCFAWPQTRRDRLGPLASLPSCQRPSAISVAPASPLRKPGCRDVSTGSEDADRGEISAEVDGPPLAWPTTSGSCARRSVGGHWILVSTSSVWHYRGVGDASGRSPNVAVATSDRTI